jgi:hypothetical protein
MPAPVAWRNLFISAADIVTVLIYPPSSLKRGILKLLIKQLNFKN